MPCEPLLPSAPPGGDTGALHRTLVLLLGLTLIGFPKETLMEGPFSPSGHGWGGEAWAGCCSPWVFTQEFLSVPVSHLKHYSLDLPGTRDVLL